MQFSIFTLTPLLALTNAHIILENPQPFTFAAYGPSNPIDPSGSDFPCKVPPGKQLVAAGPPTPMAIGAPQLLSFTGVAVHGGGSCQLSLTKDMPPTKDSDWMVIHSIEGGCPARNRAGNLDPGEKPDTYNFTIPQGVEPGEYVFSWTWVNRIGGAPEYYQNCAPIKVTDGNGQQRRSTAERRRDVSRREAFPPMFMANIGDVGGGCLTSEAWKLQQAIAYPNPGPSVERPEGGDKLFKQGCDGNSKAKAGGVDPAASSAENATSASTVVTASTASTSIAVETPVPPIRPTSNPAPAPPADTPTTSADVQPTSTAPVESSSATPPETSAPSESCQEGYFNCLDGTSFSICTGGIWTPPQPFPAGSRCKVGQSASLVFDQVNNA